MRTLGFLLQKEFRQIFRDPSILRLIFVMPLIQLLVLPWAADYEVRNLNLAVVDRDHSTYARELVRKVTSSAYFRLQPDIPPGFGRLDDTSAGNVAGLQEVTAAYCRDQSGVLDSIASALRTAGNEALTS